MDLAKGKREEEHARGRAQPEQGQTRTAAQCKPQRVCVGCRGLWGEMGGKPATWGVKSDVGGTGWFLISEWLFVVSKACAQHYLI